MALQIIDLLFYKPKKILSAKVYNDFEKIDYMDSIIIKVKIIKHYQIFLIEKFPIKYQFYLINKKYH